MSAAPRRTAIVVSISSDIGAALADRLRENGWTVAGTFRTASERVRELEESGLTLVRCDLREPAEIDRACEVFRRDLPAWDAVVLCPGTLDPIGPFPEVDFEAWAESITTNFTNQLRFVHNLLPGRNVAAGSEPCILFFAAGGTNSAPTHFSAYTASKIALIKMCELLDAEVPDTRFAILGPGWVRTKIHQETLAAGARAGGSLQQTIDRITEDRWVSMDRVIDCCTWVLDAPRDVVGGRNISVEHDRWGADELAEALRATPSMYKLRRAGNDWK